MATAIMLVGVGLALYQILGLGEEGEGEGGFRRVVFPIRHTGRSANLGVEYHFDRNAIVDSRRVDSLILGLVASGNLVVFDSESFALRSEKVQRRRVTCLGPSEDNHVLAGIANGCIVRVSVGDLAFERVDDVPGVPRWIGKRAKNGALVVAYQSEPDMRSDLRVKDLGNGRTYDVGERSVLFLDSKDRLWIGSGAKVQVLDLEGGALKDVALKGGWPGVVGFTELTDGQVWEFGGTQRTGEATSFIARVSPGAKPTVLYQAKGKDQSPSAPVTPVTHVLDDVQASRLLVVTHNSVFVTDPGLGAWQPLDAMGGGHREDDAIYSFGQAHATSRGILLTLARGGFMEVTSEFTRRHLLDGQYSVSWPSEIVRLEKGMAFFGDGGPSFYAAGKWRTLPDPVVPPAELMGPARAGGVERVWAAMLTIPLGGETSYVIAKAGAMRHYLGHIHGLRDTFLTARWDGKTLAILGREDLPIEPADTFVTPDQRLWNVDDQGLWSFSGGTEGRWRLVMRVAGHGGTGAHMSTLQAGSRRGRMAYRSAVGEPLHFADSVAPPYYGLPTSASSWALVRLDINEEGGIPLIDEVPVSVDGRRLLIHDLMAVEGKKDEFLLATDHGLCLFNVKFGTCDIRHPEGLDGEVSLIRRDSKKRVWLGGRGLWVLRDLKHVVPVHPSVPVLDDARVVAMAEATDGRLVLGLENRGAVFLTLPDGWVDRSPDLPRSPLPWEATRPHEPSHREPSLVLRECQDKAGLVPESTLKTLIGDLRGFAETSRPANVRVETEATFEGHPDIVVRCPEPETLQDGIVGILGKLGLKGRYALWKRRGPRGSDAVQIRYCLSR